MELTRHGPDDPQLPAILTLIRESFAYMDGLIDPPSSMYRLTLDSLRQQSQAAEIWSTGIPLVACVIFTPKPHALDIGKLCVAAPARGKGLSKQLMDHATHRAGLLGLPLLELEVRIELTSNHAAFAAMGFSEVARTAHAGYDKPTSIRFQKTVPR